ncbi:MAG: mechanosensitive ion channel [Phycisphaerales bacterium]
MKALRAILCVLVLMLGAAAARAQGDASGQATGTPAASAPTPATTEAAPRPGLSSPRMTIATFRDAMHEYSRTGDESALSRAADCCDLGTIQPISAGREQVANLYSVLLRIEPLSQFDYDFSTDSLDDGRWSYFPSDRDNAERTRMARRFESVKIDLTGTPGGEWRFSAETMQRADAMLRVVESQPKIGEGSDVAVTLGQRIRAMVPASLRSGEVLTLEYWQWLAILIVVLAGMTFDLLVRFVLSAAWRRYRSAHKKESDAEVVRRAVRPFGMLAAAVVWYAVLQQGGLPPVATKILLVAVRVFLGVMGVWAAFRVTDLVALVLRERAHRTKTRFDDLLVPLIERTLKVFFVAMGLIYVADSFDVEILPLLTGLGIGGLAVAFAAKDTIENFFGSVAVILDRPFEVGDWVVIGDVEGTVETMGMRSTRIRTFYHSLVTVPNASLVRATVDNYGRRRFRRFKTTVSVTYGTSPEKIEAFCEGIRELVRLHPYTRKDYYHAWLNEFGASSLDVMVYVFFECPDWSMELRERHRLMLDVVRLADRLGVEFAFPTQTLHVYQEDAGAAHAPAGPPDGTFEERAHAAAHEAVRALTGEQKWQKDRPGPVIFGRAKTKG